MNWSKNDLSAIVIGALLLLIVAGVNAWAMLAASACGTAALFATCRKAEMRRGLLIVLIACTVAAGAAALIVHLFY